MSITDFEISIISEPDIHGLNMLPPSDWKFNYEMFLKEYLKEGFFHAFKMTQGGEIIGTGNVFLKNKVGWLANIVVTEKLRKRGLGFRITNFLVEFLKDRGCKTLLLIATEYGEPVYRKNGFRTIVEYQSYDSEKGYEYVIPKEVRRLRSSDHEAVIRLDKETNGEDRSHLMKKYLASGYGYYSNKSELLGFYLPEFGRGLVISKDTDAGMELLNYKHSTKGKRTLLPVDNVIANKFLEGLGLKKGYKCSRMLLGEENEWIPGNIFSYGSGYCG